MTAAAADRWLEAQRLIAAQATADDRPGNVADQLRRVCVAAVSGLSAAGVGVSVMSAAG